MFFLFAHSIPPGVRRGGVGWFDKGNSIVDGRGGVTGVAVLVSQAGLVELGWAWLSRAAR